MKSICLTIFLAVGAFGISAQTLEPPKQSLPTFYYQIFLTEPIDSVGQIYYQQDSTAVQFQLSPDKMAIYLLDYDGERTIHIDYFKAGMPADMNKPHCHVHALEHL
jgi:hypothetical protein